MLIPVVVTTFVRERSLGYTIASHFVVDVLNLSLAMFMGLRLRTV